MERKNIYNASGAKGITIQIPAKSKAYLPDVLDLKDKTIKYIDFCNTFVIKDANDNTISQSGLSNCYLNLIEDGTTNLFYKDVCITHLNPETRRGERDLINKKIDFVNSFIINNYNYSLNLFFVFWFEDSTISNPVTNDIYYIDNCEVRQFDTLTNKMLFNENRTLTNKKIAFFDFPISETSFKTPSGKTNVNYTILENSFLTLVKNNYMFIENVPLFLFSLTNGMSSEIFLQNIDFDLQNSFISLPNSLKSTIAGNVYFCNIYYLNN